MNKQFLPVILVTLLLGACKGTQVITAQPEEAIQEDTTEMVVAEEEDVQEVARPYHPSKTLQHDLIHTKLEVHFDWEKHQLLGVATLELKPYFYPQDSLTLDAKNFDIHSVSMVKNSEERPLNYKYDGMQLHIDLGKTFSRDEAYFVKIDYTAKPDEAKVGGSEAITSDKGLYFIDSDSTSVFGSKPRQIWTQGETQANSHWFPTIDTPNERCTQEIYITVADKYKTLSNGVLVYSQMDNDSTRTDYWQMDKAHPPYLFMMAVGEYAVVKDTWENMPVNYYVEPAYEEYAQDIFGNTPEMIQFFSDKLGVRYPWPKYSQVVVRDYVSGAMENTTASTFMEALQVDDHELLDYNWDGIIAHELFHHWFGDLVTCESWANLPLNESFASYAEYLWNEYKYGRDEAAYGLWEQQQNYLQEAETKQVDMIRFDYDDREDMFDRHSYDKGSVILHMLRNVVGDDAFFASLNRYLEKNAYTSVEIHNLRLAFEEVTGQDMNWFFNQWFLSSGHPQLKVTQQYKPGKLTLKVEQTQDKTNTPVYRLPLAIEIWSGGQKKTFNKTITDASSEWILDVQDKPETVIIDPKGVLLAEIEYARPVEEEVAQARYADNFMKQYEALTMVLADTTVEATVKNELIEAAMEDDFWVIRQLALNALMDGDEPISPAMQARLTEISQKDLKSLVRADAITALSTSNPQGNTDIYLQGLEDLSYAVNGSAIAAYMMTDATDKRERFAPFEKINNVNVTVALAEYFISEGITGKYQWFKEKMNLAESSSLYYLINYFARYLLVADPQNLEQGIELLGIYAIEHPQYYIRLAAYRSLGLFSDEDGVGELREKIKNEEKDEKLKSLYQSIP